MKVRHSMTYDYEILCSKNPMMILLRENEAHGVGAWCKVFSGVKTLY